MNDLPPPVDSSPLEARLRPLVQPKPPTVPSSEAPPTPSAPVKRASSPAVSRPKPSKAVSKAPATDNASLSSRENPSVPPPSPATPTSSSTQTTRSGHLPDANSNNQGQEDRVNWSLIWALVAVILALVAMGVYSQWKTETRVLQSRISKLSKELDQIIVLDIDNNIT